MDILGFAADLLTPPPSAAGDGWNARYSDRACPPEETFARVSPLLAGYGITRVARQTGLDRIGIPVWSAIRPNSLSLAVNNGKGITDADAKVSAVMEALERAVAGEPERMPKHASAAALRREGLAADRLDGLIGKDQVPLGDDDALDWIEGYDLMAGGPVWVPRDAAMLDRTASTRFWQSSDGLASGNTPLEATFHGLLERVERDAETLWAFAGSAERASRCIDPAAFADPVIDALCDRIADAGLRLRVFDIASDTGIACFQALIGPGDIGRRRNLSYVEVANGSGCHPDPTRAAIRAITEAAQSRLTLISGSRDDIPAETYERPLPPGLIEDLACIAGGRLLPAGGEPGRPLATRLRDLLDALQRIGIDSAIAVPLNPVGAAFSVVKVLVTGLENPPGERRVRFGRRALTRMMRGR